MLTESLIIDLLLILLVAWIFGRAFERLQLPSMLGEILAGLILGPPVLGLIEPSVSLEFLAELGIFFAMFYAGMEMDPWELLGHFWESLLVAVGGFFLPFALGFGISLLFGGTVYQSLFVGMGLSITAIAVQAVILQSLRIQHTNVGHIIMGAAIVDDILSLCTLSVLLGLAKSGTIEAAAVGMIVVKVVLFFGATIIVGHFVMPVLTRKLDDYQAKGFTFAMVAALTMACLAEIAGLHLVIGAFLAGQFVRKEMMDEQIYNAISDRFYGLSSGFLVPIFFASLSFHIQLEWSLSFWVFGLSLTLIAIIGKVVGCSAGARLSGLSRAEATVIGIGMNGRGAVELVVATVVIKLSDELLAAGKIADPLLTPTQFSGLILMAFITTLLTPILLRWSVTRTCSLEEKESFCRLMEEAQSKPYK